MLPLIPGGGVCVVSHTWRRYDDGFSFFSISYEPRGAVTDRHDLGRRLKRAKGGGDSLGSDDLTARHARGGAVCCREGEQQRLDNRTLYRLCIFGVGSNLFYPNFGSNFRTRI